MYAEFIGGRDKIEVHDSIRYGDADASIKNFFINKGTDTVTNTSEVNLTIDAKEVGSMIFGNSLEELNANEKDDK